MGQRSLPCYAFLKRAIYPIHPWNCPANTPSQVFTNQISPCLSWQPQGGSTLIMCRDNAPLLEFCLISLSFTAVITTGDWWLSIPTLATDKLNLHSATFYLNFSLNIRRDTHLKKADTHTSCAQVADVTFYPEQIQQCKRWPKSPVENAGTNVLCSHFLGWAAVLQYSNYYWISNYFSVKKQNKTKQENMH